jgi:hypothetical protein
MWVLLLAVLHNTVKYQAGRPFRLPFQRHRLIYVAPSPSTPGPPCWLVHICKSVQPWTEVQNRWRCWASMLVEEMARKGVDRAVLHSVAPHAWSRILTYNTQEGFLLSSWVLFLFLFFSVPQPSAGSRRKITLGKKAEMVYCPHTLIVGVKTSVLSLIRCQVHRVPVGRWCGLWRWVWPLHQGVSVSVLGQLPHLIF